MALTFEGRVRPATVFSPSLAHAGGLTWTVGAGVSFGLVGLAAVTGSGLTFLAAAISMAFIITFLVAPVWGLAAILAARPSLDAWANSSVVSIPGHRGLNAGSLMALVVIVVGGAYLLEHLSALRRAPCAWPFLAFAGLASLSVLLGPAKSVGAAEVLRFMAVFILYGVTFVAVRRTRDMAVVAVALLGSALIPALTALNQSLVVGIGGGRHSVGRAHGTFVTVDGLGIFMALIITFATPIALARGVRWRWLLWLAAPLAVAALVSSYGRTGWAASVVGLMVVGMMRYRVLVVVLPVLLVAVALAVPSTTSRVSDAANGPTKYGPGNTFTGRVDMWRAALPNVQRRPVQGQGFGTIPTTAKRQVANDYVRAVVEVGIPGLLVYVWLLVTGLVGAYKGALFGRLADDRLAAAVALGAFAAVPAYMLMSITSNLMTQVVLAGTFWPMVACAHALCVHDWNRVRP